MSTTTDPARPVVRRASSRRAARAIGAAAAVLATWYGGLAALARWAEPTDEVIAIVEPARVAALLSVAPVRVIDADGAVLHLRGDARGFVAALYAGGARLVLPASGAGCRGGRQGPPGASTPARAANDPRGRATAGPST